MRAIILAIFLFFINVVIAISQQNVKGLVLDAQADYPLVGATVEIIDSETFKGAVTDIEGYFIIPNVEIGRYAIRVSYLGYGAVTLPNVEITSGKEVYLEIKLEEAINTLNEVVITAEVDKDKAQNELATISARTFSVEEVNRFSGGRSDVARLASNFAGVATSNDSRNDIVIRGNSPTGVLWRLEGIPIPNPNHFATLGTTGGPVSALNPNMLKNSDFLTSAFPAEYGNALAGVFDLGFRKGNKDKHEFMFQMGAISGIELMAEGPINKSNGSSYLITGRYSFLGFAQAANLPIGTNATPDYRDLSFNFNFGKSKAGNFSLFGIGGSSDISFLHDEVDENDLFAAADEDAFAESRFGVVGLKHNILVDKKTYFRTVASVSTSGNIFNNDRILNAGTGEQESERFFEADNTENRYSLTSFVNRKFNAKFNGRVGILYEFSDYNLNTRTRQFTNEWFPLYDFEDGSGLFQAFAQSQYRVNKKFTINTGLHFQHLFLNDTWALEPRLALNYKVAKRHTINLGYGIHNQNASLPILLEKEEVMAGDFEETNLNLSPTRNQHFVAGLDSKLGNSWTAKMEVYYQYIDNVPVDPFESSFSLLNEGADFGFAEDKEGLINEGTGSNVGLELTVEKFFSQGYYGLLTGSLYDSKYVGSDGVERNTAFNNGYVLNVLAGKEFKFGRQDRLAFTLDTKLTTAGGRYATPVDLDASRVAQREVLLMDEAFSERFDPYFRWDVKLGMKINSLKRNISHHFYFDIQNVTNNTYLFARRYNALTNEVNDVFQLGFFPDFMYRIQF